MPKANIRALTNGSCIAETRFADWLSCSTAQEQPAPSVRGV